MIGKEGVTYLYLYTDAFILLFLQDGGSEGKRQP